tara:strand:- start:4906 stop:5433 length:528 start_codon:yes stop_codon:yes gene_type:complete
MKKRNLIVVAILLSSAFLFGCAGTGFEKALFEETQEIKVIEKSDGTLGTVTNIVVRPKYQDHLETGQGIASAVHPLAGWGVSIVGGILGLIARSKTRSKSRLATQKQLTLTKAIKLHGDEALALVEELSTDDAVSGKLKARFKNIQDKLGIWEDVSDFLEPASEIERLAREKWGK